MKLLNEKLPSVHKVNHSLEVNEIKLGRKRRNRNIDYIIAIVHHIYFSISDTRMKMKKLPDFTLRVFQSDCVAVIAYGTGGKGGADF